MKNVFFIVGFCIIAFIANAQNFKGSAFLGSSWSHMRGDHMVGYNKPGLNLGLKVSYPFKKNLDMSMALTFSQKGSRRTYDQYGNPQGGANSWHLMRANYFEVPFNFHFFFLEKFELSGGIAWGRLMGEYLEYWSGTGPENDKILRKNEYSFQLGAAYAWREEYQIFIRHNTSITSVLKNDFSFFFSPYNVGLVNLVATVGIERKF